MTTAHDQGIGPTVLPLTRQQRSSRTAELLADAARSDGQELHDMHDEVLTLNIGVAHAIARRFKNRGIDVQDLEQVACEALIKAVQRFDPAHDRDFLAFAVPTIRGELQRHFRDSGWMVRPTRRVQETQWRAAREGERLSSRLGRPPTDAEVRAALDLTQEEYAEARSAQGCFSPTSLDRPLTTGDGGADLGSTLRAEDLDLVTAEMRILLVPLLRRLPERERLVVYLRFFEDRSQVEIGIEIGVGQAQVSRILAGALKTMRTSMDTADAA